MSASGNKLLTVFLFFSIVFFAVAWLAQKVPAIDPDVDMQHNDASGGVSAMETAASDSDVKAEAEATATPAPASASIQERGNDLTLGSYALGEPARQLKLPKRLREISGLAMLPENRFLAHDDERGVVVEIDYHDGSIVKDFALGNRRGSVGDDFEGIAAADGRLYLVSSSGRIYEFGEGDDGTTVLYSRYETEIGRDYEIEGLAYNPDQRALLLISKNPRRSGQEDLIAIYRWSIDTRRLVEDSRILIEASTLAPRIGRKRFQPSGIERHPVSGNYFVVAARQRAVAEITPQGTVLAVTELSAGQHRQAEGITFASDNTMVIADEGAGKRATLSFYPVEKVR